MEKKYLIPIFVMLGIGLVFAGSVFWHTTSNTLTVTEARSSADSPLTLSGKSGETVNEVLTINNAGTVPLCAKLTWVEDTNPNGVTYTNNLGDMQNFVLNPLAPTTKTVTFVFNPTTEAGTVTGTINYEKVAC